MLLKAIETKAALKFAELSYYFDWEKQRLKEIQNDEIGCYLFIPSLRTKSQMRSDENRPSEKSHKED